jgi:hypothetical protein
VNGGFDLGKSAGLDLGVSWLESDGFPDQASTADDRGFRDVSANLQLRATLGSAEVALRHWRTQGNSEYSDFFLTPLDQDYLTSTTTGELSVPVGSAGNARVAVSHLEDKIEQNQSPDFVETKRDTAEAQFDWKPRGSQTFGSVLRTRTRMPTASRSAHRCARRTDSVSAYVQDRIGLGPHLGLLALGYTDHETAGSAVTGSGIRLHVQPRQDPVVRADAGRVFGRRMRPTGSASVAIPT